MANWIDLEAKLKGLIEGQYSSLSLSFNDDCGPNYSTVARDEEERPGSSPGDWVSEEERQRAIALNSKWTLHWYPRTPVGFYAISASSLEALIAGIPDD